MIMPALHVEGGGGAAKVALASVFDGHMGYQVPAPFCLLNYINADLFTQEKFIQQCLPAPLATSLATRWLSLRNVLVAGLPAVNGPDVCQRSALRCVALSLYQAVAWEWQAAVAAAELLPGVLSRDPALGAAAASGTPSITIYTHAHPGYIFTSRTVAIALSVLRALAFCYRPCSALLVLKQRLGTCGASVCVRRERCLNIQDSTDKKPCVRTLSYISRVDLPGRDYAGDTSGVGPALARAFQAMEAKVLHVAREDGKDYGSTATVALCFPAHRSLFVAHVGDSRSVLCRWASDSSVLKLCTNIRVYPKPFQVPDTPLLLPSKEVFTSLGSLFVACGCESQLMLARRTRSAAFAAPALC